MSHALVLENVYMIKVMGEKSFAVYILDFIHSKESFCSLASSVSKVLPLPKAFFGKTFVIH